MEGEKLGKYEVRRTLGRGAMGTVYEGWDPQIARKVAIKTVKRAAEQDTEAQEQFARFKREAQAAGRLHHPNIVGVFDYGETEDLAYIVMEFIDGEPLKAVLDRGERFALGDAVRILEELLGGLRYSHERGVVHRDIKPANIMLTREGGVKIADFGIARIESSSMTQAGTVLGTPAYMSPEQFMGETVDARTDIYSAGVVLYQLLTGERPFEGSVSAIMHKVLSTVPPRPSELSVTAPASLDAVVAKAMAKRPEERYASAAAFAEALRAAATAPALPVEPDGTVIAAAGTTRSRPPPVPDVEPAPVAAPASRKMLLPAWIGAAVILVILVAGGAWFFAFRPGPTRHAAAPVQTAANTPPVPAPAATTPAPAAPAASPPEPKAAQGPTTSPAAATSAPQPTSPPAPATSAPAATTPPPTTPAPAAPPPEAKAPPTPTPASPSAAVASPPVATTPPPTTPAPTSPPPEAKAPPAPTPASPSAAVASTPTAPPAATTPPPAATIPPPTTPAPTAPPPEAKAPPTPTPASPPAAVTSAPPLPTPPSPPPAASTPAPAAVALVEPSPQAVRRAVAAALAPVGCTLVGGSLADAGKNLILTGVAGLGAPVDALHGAILDAAPTATADWGGIATFTDPKANSYCRALDFVRPIATPFGAPQRGFSLGIQGGHTTLADGDPLVFRLTIPNFGGWLTVDYFASDGSVAHLYPTAANPAQAYPAGQTVVLGAKAGWTAGTPYGRDMVLAIASSEPLLQGLRSQDEPTADAYLAALGRALAAARTAGESLDAKTLLLETHAKR